MAPRGRTPKPAPNTASEATRCAHIQWWSAKLLRLLGVRLTVDGRFQPGAQLVVCNHISWLDILAINAVQPVLRDARPLFQTVRPLREPRAETVLGRARFERPVVDAASTAALTRLPQLQAEPGRRVWLRRSVRRSP